MDFPKSVPSVGLVDGKFIDEDAVAGTPGSLIPSAWGNAITLEILSVIEAAGLEPDEETTDQLLQAIDVLVTSAAPGLATELHAGVAKIATAQDMAEGTDDEKFSTAKKIKTWFASVMKQATETAFGWAKVATQPQANSGVDDTSFITAKKLSGAISALVIQATEAISGIAKVAPQAVVNAGSDDATFVTPKKMRFGFTGLFGASGYITFPAWMGGFMIQWGNVVNATADGTQAVSYPTSFATQVFGMWGNLTTSTLAANNVSVYCQSTSLAGGNVSRDVNGSPYTAGPIFWVAIGN